MLFIASYNTHAGASLQLVPTFIELVALTSQNFENQFSS